ncbi:hypothetical protein [Flavivirga aquatica]|uniref:hypothetical protein n=1 Tax=Flavivirga aquatica TaxID=1849968 RepID=UPI000F4D854B|nr:hypothetical protein [Flavivirga aquatica]
MNGKGSAVQIPKIVFDPKTTPEAEEPRFNKYGLDLTNPDYITYKRENLQAEIIGGIQTQVLTRFNVLLKIAKRPQQSAMDVYRNNVDLYNENNIQHFVKQAQIKLNLDATKITDFIYDLIERLEQYRKDKATYIPENHVIASPQPKVSKKVDKILRSDTLTEGLKQLFAKSGMACPKIGLQLFLIALSSKLPSTTHAILQGNPELTSILIQSFSKVLPNEVNRFKTSISDNVLYYAPDRNYWNNKVLLLPTIDKLGKNNTALSELISQGQVDRLVTENTTEGIYRAKNRLINGRLSLISSTNAGYNELCNNDNVVTLPLTNPKAIKQAITTHAIKKCGGLINETEVEQATKLLQFVFRELKPVNVVNPHLEQLNIARYFDEDYKQIKQFLQLTSLVTLLHQKQLGVTKKGNAIQAEVQPKHMLIVLELFQELWVKEESELSYKIATTFRNIKMVLQKGSPKNHQNTEFTVKAMRERLKMHPKTLSRHILALYDYNKIERTGGNQKDGYTYKVISWNDNTPMERFEQFKTEVSQ